MECRVCNKVGEMKTKFSCIECCKEKRKIASKKYSETHKEQLKTASKQYHETHKDHIKKYYETNKQHILETNKTYRQENKDKIKIQKKNYAETHKETIKTYMENNKEYISERSRNYRKMQFIRYLLLHCKGKKLKFDLDEEWIKDGLKLQNNKCFYCKFEIYEKNDEKWTKFLQISIDRKDSNIGYLKENCVLSCLFCNLTKNASLVEHFIDYINALKTGILDKYKDEKKDTQWASDLTATMKTLTTKEKISNQFSSGIIKEMFKNQNGKDYFTGLSLISSTRSRFPFKPSIDRLDNSKPHTLDNCVLVCLAGNYGRHVASVDEYKHHLDVIRNK